MGLTTGDFPPVDSAEFLSEPLSTRIRVLTQHWVEYGFGSPRMIHLIYVVKLLVFYLGVGLFLVTATSGAGWFWDVASWWNEPIVYQKFLVWTTLLEAVGLAGSWGPLAGKFKPMTGGILFWARPGTIRLRPWKWVPLTSGDTRTVVDVVLYLAPVVSLAVAVVLPGRTDPHVEHGLIQPAPLIVAAVLLVVVGLRDKTIAIATRIEQYLPALVFMSLLSFVDMIVALKLLIVSVWVGAGVAKIGRHFEHVIPPMLSNTPFYPPKWLKRAMYRDFPNDLRPSGLARFTAHGVGTAIEIAAPLLLLFSQNFWVTLVGVILMVGFHLFILSTFPLAVPLEWNILFIFAALFLFIGFPASAGYAVTDLSSPWLAAGIVAALVFFPILGNLRPDLVSFLPSMRQYAGNWASALWAFTPGAESKLNAVTRPARNQVDQLVALKYPADVAEVTLQQAMSWRTMHSQGKGLLSVLYSVLPDIETRTVREAEFGCNSVIGFNFGDGHLHNEDLIAALQSRCRFEPGEFVVAWVESQPIHKGTQRYKVIDAALGVIERGTWNVRDAIVTQPWLPDGPIPLVREKSAALSEPFDRAVART